MDILRAPDLAQHKLFRRSDAIRLRNQSYLFNLRTTPGNRHAHRPGARQ